MYNVCVEKLYIKILHIRKGGFPMYFPTSSALIEFLILAVLEQDDSYGYEISQTKKVARQSRVRRMIRPFQELACVIGTAR